MAAIIAFVLEAIIGFIASLVTGIFVMWLAPAAFPGWHPGYWQSVFIGILAYVLVAPAAGAGRRSNR